MQYGNIIEIYEDLTPDQLQQEVDRLTERIVNGTLVKLDLATREIKYQAPGKPIVPGGLRPYGTLAVTIRAVEE